MNKSTKILLILITIFIALAAAVFVLELTSDKKEYVTDPVIAHIPIRAELTFFAPALNQTADITYTLTPTVDVRVNVSEGLILPEGIVFVENNLPTGQITLKKGKKYRYSAKIKTVEIGNWMIYASPGVYADVDVFEERASVAIYEVRDATVPLTRYCLRENVSKVQQDAFKDATKYRLREYGYDTRKYGEEEFKCSVISLHYDVPCYGCEIKCYSNSTLCDKYYFVIEEDLNTNKTTIRNVYRWAYWTPSGYQRRPICEEITIKTTVL
ncbi:MAG: hypothetical protein U9N07_06080 [Euryarchaeota archaeon]|nr:hypothetical protein [Euryarchaeota archaeon]